jgi:hypothetical protein|nr:MAG TPA_asm: hypothetical protein [Caudoviricetes sp.]
MDTNKILDFIQKLIEKTGDKTLNWTVLSNNDFLRPLPDAEYPLAFGVEPTDELLANYSYVTNFKTAKIFLLSFSLFEEKLRNPPDDCTLSLRIQTDTNKFAMEITSSQFDPVDASALIRLYNVIDNNSPSISVIIDDFLNS